MKFLLDANMPRAALRAVIACGHDAEHVRDLDLGDATDDRIEAHARSIGAVLVTRDLDFADIRRGIPPDSPGVLVLRMPDDSTATAVADVVKRFVLSADLVVRLPGHLVIVEPSRARFRPPL